LSTELSWGTFTHNCIILEGSVHIKTPYVNHKILFHQSQNITEIYKIAEKSQYLRAAEGQ